MPGKKRAYSYVRFSSPDQARGDSLRRQLAITQDYAKRHNLALDESLGLQDKGMSAFRGANVEKGALALFFKEVERGRVPAGSVLLVESLDRLSRQEPELSVQLLLQIINSGIEVHTMRDNQVYRQGGMNLGTLVTSVVSLSGAHEESAKKSERLAAAWKQKKVNARINPVPISGSLPGWIDIKNGKHVLIPERAKIVQEIFKLHIGGLGRRAIARELNQRRVRTWGRSKAWQPSYIDKVLNNGLAIGTYQPHKGRGKNRQPDGGPILGFYPAAVSQKLWDQVQARRVGGPPRAKRGLKANNLFEGLAHDGHSGATMHYVHRYSKKSNHQWRYLVSDQHRVDPDYPTTRANYTYFELAFLRFMELIDWGVVTGISQDPKELEKLKDRVAQLEKRKRETQTALKNVTNAIAETPNFKALAIKGQELESTLASISRESVALRGKLSEMEDQKALAGREQLNLKQLLSKLSDSHSRVKLREEIRRKVDHISIYMRGGLPTELLDQISGIPALAEKMKDPDLKNPAFFITYFRSGQTRYVIRLSIRDAGRLMVIDPDNPKEIIIAPRELDWDEKSGKRKKQGGK